MIVYYYISKLAHNDGCLKNWRQIAASGLLKILAECIVKIGQPVICLSLALNLESLVRGITEDNP